ncbi:MAG: flavin reductase [Cytophagales bacterium]|nr:flavin reductase [Cytophagales bacterium]
MKHITNEELGKLERNYRANLVNSITGYKSANLIGTKSLAGETNLAIFSSVVHLGANPALVGFIQRPDNGYRHTYENIKQAGFYTINHVHEGFIPNAHFTSAKFPLGISEFKSCGLEEEFLDGFYAPFVKQSRVKIGLRFLQEIPIELNDTILVIGQIEHLHFPESIVQSNGLLDLNQVSDVCVSGLDTYLKVSHPSSFPYAKVENVPEYLK